MIDNPSLTRTLAEFVNRTRWEDLPFTVRHEAKRSLVNYFAVALAGSADPTIEKASPCTSALAPVRIAD